MTTTAPADNIITFSAHQNIRFRLSDRAARAVARYVALRPAPNEDATAFVARIVTAYHEELGK